MRERVTPLSLFPVDLGLLKAELIEMACSNLEPLFAVLQLKAQIVDLLGCEDETR